MEKRERIILILTVLVLLSNIFWFFSYSDNAMTSFFIFKNFFLHVGTSIARVLILIVPPEIMITIYSPENTTYNFSIGDTYTISLNVSANTNVSSWWYSIEDLRHSIVYPNISFTPNTTIDAVRWSNRITIYADNSFGSIASNSTIFFVSVPNSAPLISELSNLYICENNPLSVFFNATDVDEDNVNFDITPKNPFYVSVSEKVNWTVTRGEIYSGILTKQKIGLYQEIVSVTDGQYSDSKKINITVIEINNAPAVDEIGVHTIYTQGENSTFYHEVNANDFEDGNSTFGNLTFNLTFLSGARIFNISSTGVMNFTPSSGGSAGIYNLSVCVKDTGIDDIHENISLCGQDGSPITTCKNFSLTITNLSRSPYISSYYPLTLNFSASGISDLYFNISKYDPDGTIPDAYWYVDNVSEEYDSGSSVDSFNYVFGCGVSGEHTVKVVITDGGLNDSIQWDINVELSVCPKIIPPSSGGGGGGGGGTIFGCFERWVTGDWDICQNAKASFESAMLSPEDFRFINEECLNYSYDDRYCGFQIRYAVDLNSCKNEKFRIAKPKEIQVCYYTENPSCFDGITNCHDGSCELLVDCGGPCSLCPTCSDKIKNQGEEDIDCGGPCPTKCPVEKPKAQLFNIWWIFIITIFLVLFAIIIIKIRVILKIREKLNE